MTPIQARKKLKVIIITCSFLLSLIPGYFGCPLWGYRPTKCTLDAGDCEECDKVSYERKREEIRRAELASKELLFKSIITDKDADVAELQEADLIKMLGEVGYDSDALAVARKIGARNIDWEKACAGLDFADRRKIEPLLLGLFVIDKIKGAKSYLDAVRIVDVIASDPNGSIPGLFWCAHTPEFSSERLRKIFTPITEGVRPVGSHNTPVDGSVLYALAFASVNAVTALLVLLLASLLWGCFLSVLSDVAMAIRKKG